MFELLPPFLQDYIYDKGWEELREIQVKSFECITNTQNNLLISSGTASGKTEAVFLPVLTDIYNASVSGVSVLYVSPLKALINDQYERIEEMIKDSNISLLKWHGDVYNYKKDLSITNNTILQITPESLEAILTKKSDIAKIYLSNIKYIIIDEIHYFMSSIRGEQLRCLLSRLQLLTNNTPKRIGLSATIGNLEIAAQWLSEKTERNCSIINEVSKKKIKLSINYSTFNNEDKTDITKNILKESYKTKNIIFANSRKEVEEIAHDLSSFCKKAGLQNTYYTHHASISKNLKEELEFKMKSSDHPYSAISTTTLELGIDIGDLDKIIQIGCPYRVSSFLQRLGRTGRRTGLSCIDFFIFNEKNEYETFIDSINLDLLLTTAIIELYRTEKWVEEPTLKIKPFNLLFQQTLAYLYSNGDIKQTELLTTILNFPPFSYISQKSYIELLKYMKEYDFITTLENGNILIGLAGEKLVENFNFFSMFETKPEYIVKTTTEIIGSTTQKQKIGSKFWLSGRCWKTLNVDEKNLSITVELSIDENGTNKWTSDGFFVVEDKIFKKAKELVQNQFIPPYIDSNAKEHLTLYFENYNTLVQNDYLIKNANNFIYFPWCGTKKFNTIELLLEQNNISFKTIVLNNLKFAIEISGININDFKKILSLPININDENIIETLFISGKYNKLIPLNLIKEQILFEYDII